jgi:hypothetical protein
MTKKKMFLLAAVPALILSQLAFAGTVSYTTSGTFSSSSSATSANMPVTFTGTSQTVTTPDLTALLGSFSLGTFGKCHTKPACTPTDTLTLKITQSGGGSGNLTATVNGLVALNKTTGVLSWIFTGASVTINGVTYIGLPGNSLASLNVQGIILGNVSTPEPNAGLLLGLGSLGLMGFAFASRKMINV